DSPRGKQHVDSSAGAEVQDGFARIQCRERRRISAAERSFQRFFRYLCCLPLVIETRRDGICSAARTATAAQNAKRGLAILFFHCIFNVCCHVLAFRYILVLMMWTDVESSSFPSLR